jgi:hypothetical protein
MGETYWRAFRFERLRCIQASSDAIIKISCRWRSRSNPTRREPAPARDVAPPRDWSISARQQSLWCGASGRAPRSAECWPAARRWRMAAANRAAPTSFEPMYCVHFVAPLDFDATLHYMRSEWKKMFDFKHHHQHTDKEPKFEVEYDLASKNVEYSCSPPIPLQVDDENCLSMRPLHKNVNKKRFFNITTTTTLTINSPTS